MRALRGAWRFELSKVGRWWNADSSAEIDVVGLDGKRVVLAGSVKWAKRVHSAELTRLRRAVDQLPNRADRVALVLFGRESIDAVDAQTFTCADLYADST